MDDKDLASTETSKIIVNMPGFSACSMYQAVAMHLQYTADKLICTPRIGLL